MDYRLLSGLDSHKDFDCEKGGDFPLLGITSQKLQKLGEPSARAERLYSQALPKRRRITL